MKKISDKQEKTLNIVFACLLTLSLLLFAGIPALNQAATIAKATSGQHR